jgi:sec-independent protein translocase protein TatA
MRELFQPGHLIIILLIVLLLFGGKKIPELMKGLGKGVKEFKDAAKADNKDSDNKDTTDKNKTSEEAKKE